MAEPTTEELNAGFDAAYADLIDWLMHSPEIDRNIPFVGNLKDIMVSKVKSTEGRSRLLRLVHDIIVADNAVEAKAKAGG